MCFLSKESALKVRFSSSFVEKNVENTPQNTRKNVILTSKNTGKM